MLSPYLSLPLTGSQGVRAEAEAAQLAAAKMMTELNEERAARQVAESNLSQLRAQLDNLVSRSDENRREAESAVASLKQQYEALKAKVGR